MYNKNTKELSGQCPSYPGDGCSDVKYTWDGKCENVQACTGTMGCGKDYEENCCKSPYTCDKYKTT